MHEMGGRPAIIALGSCGSIRSMCALQGQANDVYADDPGHANTLCAPTPPPPRPDRTTHGCARWLPHPQRRPPGSLAGPARGQSAWIPSAGIPESAQKSSVRQLMIVTTPFVQCQQPGGASNPAVPAPLPLPPPPLPASSTGSAPALSSAGVATAAAQPGPGLPHCGQMGAAVRTLEMRV